MSRVASIAVLPIRRYALEPGDGTRYQFSIGECAGHNSTITGVGQGNEYVTLTIYGSEVGSYEVRKDALREPEEHLVDYLKGHSFGRVYTYTIAAVIMAASVLIDRPGNLEEAMDAMLKASDLLK